MDSCINIQNKEFQELIKQANINPIILKTKVGLWQERNNTDRFPTLEELGLEKKENIVGKISTKEDPDFIPLSESSRPLYEHYGLLNKEGKVKVFKTEAQIKAAEKWVEFNNENAKYSFALRGPWNEKRIFIAQKFQNPENEGQWIHNNPNPDLARNREVIGKPVLTSKGNVVANNEENFAFYRNYKLSLIEALEDKLKKYRVLNEGIKDTPTYKAKIKEFNKTLSNLKSEVEKMDPKDATKTFKFIEDEIDILTEIVKKMSPEDYTNFNVDDRLDTLTSMFMKQDIKGNSTGENASIKSEGFENFSTILEKLINLKDAYTKSYATIIRDTIETNPVYMASVDALEGEELEKFNVGFNKLFETQKDINLLAGAFMGINSVDDTAATTAINLSLQYNLQKVQQTVSRTLKRVTELDSLLHEQKFDFENFFSKDKHGVDTGNLVHIFSSDYFTALGAYYKARKEFNEAPRTNKMPAYRNMISWLKTNTDIIDFTRLHQFKDKYGARYGEYFTHTDEEMDAYETQLRKTLGRHFELTMKEVENNLSNYDELRETQELDNSIYKEKNIKEYSPWDFIKNFHSPNASRPVEIDIEGRPVQALLRGNNITFIPKEFVENSMGERYETGYYDKAFKPIQESSEAFEYWKNVKDLYNKHIDPIYNSRGYDMHDISYGKYLKDTEEALRTKDDRPWMKKLYQENLQRFKEIWMDTRTVKENTEEVSKNYYDKSKGLISKMEELLKLKSLAQLKSMAIDRHIELDESSEITKKELVNVIARHDSLSLYSKDLTKITLALADAATMHRTRMETAQIAEIAKRFHEGIKGLNGQERTKSIERFNNWVKTNVYNQRTVQDLTKQDISETKRLGKILSDSDRTLKAIIDEVKKDGLTGDTSFNYNGTTYITNKGKYYQVSGEDYIQMDKETFENILSNYLEQKVKERGVPINFHGLWNGVLKMIIIKGLALNPKSGIYNRAEGTLTNMIRDTQGDYWTPGNLGYVKNFMSGINLYRVTDGRLTPHGKERKLQMETFMHLFEALGVYEDKKNELDRRDNVSRFKTISKKLDIYQFAVDLPEFKNQGEVIMSMLLDIKVKDIEGNEFDFFDKKTMSWTIFEPGTTTVKEEFRTPENLGWETFHLNPGEKNQFFVSKVKIDDMIKKTQGNYSKLDSIQAQDNLLGRSLMTFMRWMPEHVFQRFGVRNTDVIQGKNKVIGRFNAMYSNLPALGVYASFLAAMSFGPASILPVMGATLVLPSILKYFTKSKVNMDSQMLLHSYNLMHTAAMLQEMLVQALNFPLNLVHIKGSGKDIKSTDNAFQRSRKIGRMQPMFKAISLEEMGKDPNQNLTPEEAKAMRGIAQEMANGIGILSIMIAMKLLLSGLIGGGDDDDTDEAYKLKHKGKSRHGKDMDILAETYFYNYVANSCDRLVTGFASWSTPNAFVTQNSKIAAIRQLDNVTKLLELINKYEQGEKRGALKMIYQINAAVPLIPLPNSVTDALMKSTDTFGEGQYPFFDKKNMTEDTWYEKIFTNPEKQAQHKINVQRDFLREDLEKEYQRELEEAYQQYQNQNADYQVPTQQEIEDQAKQEADKVLKKANKKKNESYEENLERFKEFDKEVRESIIDKKK